MRTERPSPRYSAIDLWDPAEILDAMLEGQFAAVAAVHAARLALERAAGGIEERLRGGGRLVYAGAGTSGRLAVQDGAELMPTFSWPPERLVLLMAGGHDALLRAVEGAEDDAEDAAALVRQHEIDGKVALTVLSSLVMIRLGRVYEGLMVDVQATNEKLVRRSERILAQLTGHRNDRVREALRDARGSVKLALLLLEGSRADDARSALDQ